MSGARSLKRVVEKTFAWFAAIVLLLIVLSAALFVLTGGGPDYHVNLPGGYRLVRLYSDCVALAGPHDQDVVGPTVDRYAVAGQIVVGHVSRERDSQHAELGYFILDTKGKATRAGLSEGEFITALRKHGITRAPSMCRPNRFHALANLWK